MSKFKKGVSGNPKGRPKGSVNKINMLIKEQLPEVIKSLIQQVKDGDINASGLLLKYSMPVPKSVELFPEIEVPDDALLSQKIAIVEKLLMTGAITSEQAKSMCEALKEINNNIESSRMTEALISVQAGFG